MPDPRPTPTSEALDRLLQGSATLWRGVEMSRPPARTTGFRALDARLPGGGWPVGALIEIVPACEGLGEVSLLVLPLLQLLCGEARPIALVRPPHIPYAPALAQANLPLSSVLWIEAEADSDARWSAEQILRDGLAGAVLLWSPTSDERSLRRLLLAAETGRAFAFVYRPITALRQSSPSALRLALYPAADETRVELVKVRGGPVGSITLSLRSVRS